MRITSRVPGALAGVALLVAGCGGEAGHVRSTVLPTLRGHVERIPGGRDPATVAAVAFFDARRGVAATAGGTRLSSADGGRTWQRTGSLHADRIEAVSDRVAFATHGRALLRTDDAGRRWRRVGGVRRLIATMSFADARHGWFGGVRLLATDDGGRTTHAVDSPCQRDAAQGNVYEAYSRVTARLGYAACGGPGGAGSQLKQLFVTEDGARSWRPVPGAHPPEIGYLEEIDFRDRGHGFMTTARGGVFETRDGGRHWRSLLFTGDGTIDSPQRLGARTVLAVVEGTLLRSQDDGRTWPAVLPATVPQPELRSPATAQAMLGIGPGDWRRMDPEIVVASIDGGRTWQRRGTLPREIAVVNSLARASRSVVYADANRSTGRGGPVLLRTDDDGRSWHAVRQPTATIAGIAFTDPSHGLLADEAGALYATSDGGRSWTERRRWGIRLGPFAMFDEAHGIALTGGGRTVRLTDDGGRTWRRADRLRLRSALALSVVAPGHAWILDHSPCPPGRRGSRGEDEYCEAIVRTSDRGRTWQRIELDNPLDLWLPSGQLAFTTPRLGATLRHRTADGGRTWRLAR